MSIKCQGLQWYFVITAMGLVVKMCTSNSIRLGTVFLDLYDDAVTKTKIGFPKKRNLCGSLLKAHQRGILILWHRTNAQRPFSPFLLIPPHPVLSLNLFLSSTPVWVGIFLLPCLSNQNKHCLSHHCTLPLPESSLGNWKSKHCKNIDLHRIKQNTQIFRSINSIQRWQYLSSLAWISGSDLNHSVCPRKGQNA